MAHLPPYFDTMSKKTCPMVSLKCEPGTTTSQSTSPTSESHNPSNKVGILFDLMSHTQSGWALYSHRSPHLTVVEFPVIVALGITVKMKFRALWFNTSAARDAFRWGLRNWERRRRRKIKFPLTLLSSLDIELRCTPLKKQVELVCLMGNSDRCSRTSDLGAVFHKLFQLLIQG
jgi:hypothetical protein